MTEAANFHGFITEVTTSLQRSESPRSQRLTARISMSVSKPLWIRGRWFPTFQPFLVGEFPLIQGFLGGSNKPHKGWVWQVQCRWFQESSWGKKLKEMKVGLFPSGNCMKPQQLCKDDSFVQKTDSFSAFKEKVDNRKKLHEFLGLKKFGRSSLPAF